MTRSGASRRHANVPPQSSVAQTAQAWLHGASGRRSALRQGRARLARRAAGSVNPRQGCLASILRLPRAPSRHGGNGKRDKGGPAPATLRGHRAAQRWLNAVFAADFLRPVVFLPMFTAVIERCLSKAFLAMSARKLGGLRRAFPSSGRFRRLFSRNRGVPCQLCS